MRIEVGCDIEEFKRYYRNCGIHNYLKSVGVTDVIFGELGPIEKKHINGNSSHLIVLREGNEIIGHAIWHEESVDGFTEPDERKIREALERLLRRKRNFIELHEVWLEEKHRGRGYGSVFFEFFEDFMRKKGYDSIIYFAGNPVAVAICEARGYKEVLLSFPERERWHVFHLPLQQRGNENESQSKA